MARCASRPAVDPGKHGELLATKRITRDAIDGVTRTPTAGGSQAMTLTGKEAWAFHGELMARNAKQRAEELALARADAEARGKEP